MSQFIKNENYLNSLPNNVKQIRVSGKELRVLGDLTRFYQLEFLDCESNYLTQLPTLPASLKRLNCRNNQLTSLPELNAELEILNLLFAFYYYKVINDLANRFNNIISTTHELLENKDNTN
jgi:Leucine-rich repeat (LRR) protein